MCVCVGARQCSACRGRAAGTGAAPHSRRHRWYTTHAARIARGSTHPRPRPRPQGIVGFGVGLATQGYAAVAEVRGGQSCRWAAHRGAPACRSPSSPGSTRHCRPPPYTHRSSSPTTSSLPSTSSSTRPPSTATAAAAPSTAAASPCAPPTVSAPRGAAWRKGCLAQGRPPQGCVAAAAAAGAGGAGGAEPPRSSSRGGRPTVPFPPSPAHTPLGPSGRRRGPRGPLPLAEPGGLLHPRARPQGGGGQRAGGGQGCAAPRWGGAGARAPALPAPSCRRRVCVSCACLDAPRSCLVPGRAGGVLLASPAAWLACCGTRPPGRPQPPRTRLPLAPQACCSAASGSPTRSSFSSPR
jgi:hypothetical protein